MKWFEPIIAIIAIGLVILPFILKIINKKRGKPSCSCGCDCQSCSKDCMKSFRDYVKSDEFKCSCHEIVKDSK